MGVTEGRKVNAGEERSTPNSSFTLPVLESNKTRKTQHGTTKRPVAGCRCDLVTAKKTSRRG